MGGRGFMCIYEISDDQTISQTFRNMSSHFVGS